MRGAIDAMRIERHTNPVKRFVAPEISAIDQGIVMPPILAIRRMNPVVEPLLIPASLAARARMVGITLAKKKPARMNSIIAASWTGTTAASRMRTPAAVILAVE